MALCPYVDELNPESLCNAKGRRIVQKIDGVAKDMIYLKSTPTPKQQQPQEQQQVQLFNDNNTTDEGDECPF